MLTLTDIKDKGWQAGINQVINCDAFELMKLLPDGCVDLVLTDPPYNVSTNLKIDRSRWGKKQKRKAVINFDYGDWDKRTEDEFMKFTLNWYAHCKRILKDGGSIYVFFTKELISIFHQNRENIKTKNIISWIKSNPLPAFNRTNFRSAVEFIYFGHKEGKHTFNFKNQKEMNNYFSHSLVQGKNRTEHPTQKPLSLIKHFIEISSNLNDIVFDSFAGSFTTAVACKELKRNFICCDIEKKYCEVGEKRLLNVTEGLF